MCTPNLSNEAAGPYATTNKRNKNKTHNNKKWQLYKLSETARRC